MFNLQDSRRYLFEYKITSDEMAAEILLENVAVAIFSYGFHR